MSDLDEGEFAGAFPSVGDCHLAVLVHPPLTSEDVVDTRRHLLPLIVVSMPEGREGGEGGGEGGREGEREGVRRERGGRCLCELRAGVLIISIQFIQSLHRQTKVCFTWGKTHQRKWWRGQLYTPLL